MQLPKYNNVVLDHRYFLGSFRDYSGQGNHGTPTGVNFEKRPDKHVRFRGADLITVADASELQLTQGTIIGYGDFNNQAIANYDRIVSKRDGGGTNYDVRLTTSQISLWDGTNDRALATTWNDKKSIGLSFGNGVIGKVYLDGAFEGNLNAASAISVDDAPLLIGNLYGTANTLQNPLKGVLIYNTILTDAEIAQVHEWIMATKTPSYPKRNFVYPELIGNGEFGKDVLWTKGDGWSIAEGKATCDGSQIAISALTQDCTLEPYSKYTAKIYVESVTSGGLYLFVGGGSAEHITTVGKHVVVLTSGAAPTNFNIRADNNFVGSVSFASLVAGNKPYFLDNLKDANESIAAEGGAIGGFLSNTAWRFGDTSARYKISRDSINKLTSGSDKITGGMVLGGWTAQNNATLTNPSSDILRVAYSSTSYPYAYQNCFTVGRKYRIQGEGRSGGSGNTAAINNAGSSLWSNNTTSWVAFDKIITASNVALRLQESQGGTGYVEFKNITVYEIDDNDKVIECTTAGVLYQESQQAYGTWEFDFYKGATGNYPIIAFTSTSAVAGTGIAGSYLLYSDGGADRLRFYEGGVGALFSTADDYIVVGTWYKYRITRRYDGVFTAYIKGGAYTSWTLIAATAGSNPTVADQTTTTSKYVSIDFDAGDKIANFKFYNGVVTP